MALSNQVTMMRTIRDGTDSDTSHPSPSILAGGALEGVRQVWSPSCHLAHPIPALSLRSLPRDLFLSEFTNLLLAPSPVGGPRVSLPGPHGNIWLGEGRGERGRARDGSQGRAARRWDIPLPDHWATGPADVRNSGKASAICTSPASPARGHWS